MTLWVPLGYIPTTRSAVTEDSAEEHCVSNSHRKTFQVSGRALVVGKKECGPRGNVAFGVGNPEAMILNPSPSIISLLFPPEGFLRSLPPTNPAFRTNRRQNKISQQRASPAAATQQLPQQQRAGDENMSDAPSPFAPGMRVDMLMDFLKAILTPEDYAKYSARLQPPPPRQEESSIYQDLANKDKEHSKILRQVEHHRNVVRDAEAKLSKQQTILQELLDRSQCLKQEIDALQAQVAAAANPSLVIPPMPPPSNPPDDSPSPQHADGGAPSGFQIEDFEEEDEEVVEIEELVVFGSGVGAFLVPPNKKLVKKSNLKKAPLKGACVKAESRQSVFAKAGMLSARELTRLVEECSALAKSKADDELAEGLGKENSEPAAIMEDKSQDSPSG